MRKPPEARGCEPRRLGSPLTDVSNAETAAGAAPCSATVRFAIATPRVSRDDRIIAWRRKAGITFVWGGEYGGFVEEASIPNRTGALAFARGSRAALPPRCR